MQLTNEIQTTLFNNITESAKTGATRGGMFGAGLGVGLGVLFYIAGNTMTGIVIPLLNEFYKKWDIQFFKDKQPHFSFLPTVSMFTAGSAVAGALTGAGVGAVVTAGSELVKRMRY